MDDKENTTPLKSLHESKKKSESPPPRTNSFDIHAAKMDNVFIGISGLIGAGKTTLATALGKRLGLPVYYEPVTNNEYLADFYKDIKKYSFNMQVYLLNERFKQQQVIIWQGHGGVQDRTIYEDSIFAKMLCESGLMDQRDYRTYLRLFQHMSNFMKKPNIIVHLDVMPEESLRRIHSRARGCESGITLEYLTNLYHAYEEFLQDISRIIPVIKVDYNKFRTTEEMAEAIAEQYNTMTNIRLVTFTSSVVRPPMAAVVDVNQNIDADKTVPEGEKMPTAVKSPKRKREAIANTV